MPTDFLAFRGAPLRLVSAAALSASVALGTGCSAPPGQAPERVGSSSAAITGSTILSRADQWVKADLAYCQSPNGASDPDPACSPICSRESNPEWDPYRSDCSGFVSWAWGLPAPGNTTSEFAPADTSVSFVINGIDMQPGDAVNIPGDHMVLFVSWVTVGSEATFYEEPGCSASEPYAHAFTSAVTISGSDVTIAYEGKTFTAIRYTGLAGAGEAGAPIIPCTVTTTGEMGQCLDTSVCAGKGGTSTPDYCPGPANIQCCTGIPDAGPADAGTGVAPDAAMPADGGPGTDAGMMHPKGGPGAEGGAGDDAGTGVPANWDKRPPGGCTVSSTGEGGRGGAAWLLGAGAFGLVAARRRRRG